MEADDLCWWPLMGGAKGKWKENTFHQWNYHIDLCCVLFTMYIFFFLLLLIYIPSPFLSYTKQHTHTHSKRVYAQQQMPFVLIWISMCWKSIHVSQLLYVDPVDICSAALHSLALLKRSIKVIVSGENCGLIITFLQREERSSPFTAGEICCFMAFICKYYQLELTFSVSHTEREREKQRGPWRQCSIPTAKCNMQLTYCT